MDERDRDRDRLQLLDRIADRVPELDLDQNQVEWTRLDDGHDALVVIGGGSDGGDGAFLANYGDDVHAVGSLAPMIPGSVGCIVFRPGPPAAPRGCICPAPPAAWPVSPVALVRARSS